LALVVLTDAPEADVSIHSTALSDIERGRGQHTPKQQTGPPTELVLLDILQEFSERLARLETAASRPIRGSLNQKQAAEYLNRSDEWLRREHAAGRGPKRRRRGSRGWDYGIADLEAYREAEGGDAA
jgi:hypothetical protein